MIFTCRNCGGNVVFSPEKQKMYCPYCEGEDCEESTVKPTTVTQCSNCGGEIQINEYTSSSKCSYCGQHIVFDERVTGAYEPQLILPFKIGKEDAKKLMRDTFSKKIFAPDSFLSEVKLNSMEGMYVPFWLYDYDTNYDYEGKGTKVRVWRSGNTEYTETSYYTIQRNMDVAFDKVPVDASFALNDEIMDLMEPYKYGELIDFSPKYMSGFFGEIYNDTADNLESRAKQKAENDAEGLLKSSISGYTTVTPIRKNLRMQKKGTHYTLFPVWLYMYTYRGKTYRYHVNGQTGKVIGTVPVSVAKVCAYGATLAASFATIGLLVRTILEIL
ncbi:MAG: hypothetical protein IJ485_01565 [Lachnospiraceae bacterium]|nr:hypothetical protein [Lachnospiraceae bacterium]